MLTRWFLNSADWEATHALPRLADRPLLLWHGEADDVVPAGETFRLQQALIRDGLDKNLRVCGKRVLSIASHPRRWMPRLRSSKSIFKSAGLTPWAQKKKPPGRGNVNYGYVLVVGFPGASVKALSVNVCTGVHIAVAAGLTD